MPGLIFEPHGRPRGAVKAAHMPAVQPRHLAPPFALHLSRCTRLKRAFRVLMSNLTPAWPC